ncbi:MAG: transposase [Elusimicrobia bacterium]|nr:transposase [Elusimicrobiota bacterium]
MKNIILSDKMVMAEMPPRGNFVPYAKRNAEISFYIRRKPFNALRRDVANSAFLRQTTNSLANSKACKRNRTEQKLSTSRIIFSADVCHHHGPSAHQQDGDTSLRIQLFALPYKRTTLVFDIDSVVIVIYGKQAGARIGYNPKKHGRRSYHPIFCFEAHFQEFWHGSLRPGDAGASTGAIPFIKRCLAKAPKDIARSRIRFRMDA